MKEKAREPAIRFSEFAGAWEQRKAKDVLAAYSDKGHPGLDVLSATQDRGMVRRDDNNINISHDKKNEATYKRVFPGQFVIHLRSFQGGFAYSSIEGITSPAYTVFGFSKPQEHEPNFWKFVFSSEQFIKRLGKVTYGIRDGRSISYDEVLTLSFTFPGKEEQIQIAHFLDKVGALITLHQRKYEQFLILKESMIQKLFPKDGEHAPEIRFSGCAGDWEQRLLGDIYLERNERGSKSLDILSVSIHSGISEKNLDAGALGKIVRRSEDKSLYKHVFPGDLVFNMMRAWQGALGVVKKEGMVSPAYISAIPNAEVYPGFMNYCLRRKNVINQINNLSYGVTDFRKRLYWDSFVKIKISLPSISEQKKITEFLTRLDAAINLHKRRLGMLKNVKQAFLEKMFI